MKLQGVTTARQEHIPTDLHPSSRTYINKQTNDTRNPQRIHFRNESSPPTRYVGHVERMEELR